MPDTKPYEITFTGGAKNIIIKKPKPGDKIVHWLNGKKIITVVPKDDDHA